MAFLIFLFILGLLIIVHEFGHFIAAKRMKVRVEKFSLGFGPEILSKKKNDTQYCISAVPLGGYVKLAGDNLEEFRNKSDEYFSKTPLQRAVIIFLGPLLNYVLGFLCFWLIFFCGYPALTAKVGGLMEGFPAKDAGVQVGDRIKAIDEEKVNFWEDIQKIVFTKKAGNIVRLSVLRNDKEYTIDVRLKERQFDDALGQKRSFGLLGITPADEIKKVRHGFGRSFILGLSKTWDLTTLTYKALWRMITGRLSIRESVTGPLGVFYITSKAAKIGLVAILYLVATLSISLAIINLLPLPVLDGGHIFLLLIEKIRGRYLSLKAERIITNIGYTIIITLAIFVTYNDIVRFFGDKIAKFLK